MNDDAVSGIHFIVNRGSKRGKRDDRNSMGSTNSMASLQQTPMARTASVTSMLKRLFSREDPRGNTGTQTDGGTLRLLKHDGNSAQYPIDLTHLIIKVDDVLRFAALFDLTKSMFQWGAEVTSTLLNAQSRRSKLCSTKAQIKGLKVGPGREIKFVA